MKSQIIPTLIAVSFLTVHGALRADVLTPQKPVEVAGTRGFDFIEINAARHRLLACHTGNGTLDVIDTGSSRLIRSVPTGAAQGVAIDDRDGIYYVSASRPPQLAIVDASTLEVTGTVRLPDPADLVAFDPTTERVFVCDDEKPQLWTIDPAARKIIATLTLPGDGMEDIGVGADKAFLYQNLKNASRLAEIDLLANKVIEVWPTAPADKPHGLAIVSDENNVLIAGGSGKLSLLSLATGRVLASVDIATQVDEIGYDPGWKRVYCASGFGSLSVVQLGAGKLTNVATVKTSRGAHSVAVDPSTHTVWIVYAKDGQPYVQAFTAHLR